MKTATTCAGASTSFQSLWLILELNEQYRAIELRERRLVVFGSSPKASVRIEDAPFIAFYVERDTEGVWLCPVDATVKLEVAAPPRGARIPLINVTRVEVAGVRLSFGLRDSAPTLGSRCYCSVELVAECVPPVIGPDSGYAEFVQRDSLAARSSAAAPCPKEIRYGEDWLSSECTSATGHSTNRESSPSSQLAVETTDAQSREELAVDDDCSSHGPRISGARMRRIEPGLLMRRLAQLGVLAMRRPIHVMTAALLGSFFLSILLSGLVRLLGSC
jgi:hypothetical protein